MIQLFVCDWEGCVVDAGGGTVPFNLMAITELAREIQRLHETPDGPAFVLCSGRQFPYGEAAIQMLNAYWPERPSIFEGGAGLYFPMTKRVLLNPAISKEVLRAMEKVRNSALQFIEQIGGERELGKEFSVSLNPPAGMSIEAFYEQARQHLTHFVDYGIVEMTHSKSAIDITPRGVNKGSAIEFLAEVTQIPLEQMCAIGDTTGDIPMLRVVGHPACPQNADENIKAMCEFVAPRTTTLGVVDIVRHYLV